MAQTIRRGTTPTITVSLGIDLSDADLWPEVVLTLKSGPADLAQTVSDLAAQVAALKAKEA